MKKPKKAASKLIAPSILSADFSNLEKELAAVEKAGADWIHLDIMDGHFVPNLTFGPPVLTCLKDKTSLPLDAHLMVMSPESLIPAFAKAGADIITVHHEACTHLHRVIQMIRDHGCKAGVSINPATPVDVLYEILPELDLVLIMSVNPGFGGQKFIPQSLNKVQALDYKRTKDKLKFVIEIDGGINASTIHSASQAGCDVFVAGSAIFGSKNYEKAILELRSKL